jgi:hypothetical protein
MLSNDTYGKYKLLDNIRQDEIYKVESIPNRGK